MKKFGTVLIALFACFAGLSPSANAELPVPRHVFKMDELEEAIAEAVKDDKPLIFVYTSTFST